VTAGRDPRQIVESYASRCEMDGELLSRVRTGDEEAFVMLVGRTSSHAARGVFIVSNQAVAEEAVQDTWLGVVRASSSSRDVRRSRPGSFESSLTAPAPLDPGTCHASIETLQAVDPIRFDANGQWADPLDHWTEESEDRLDAAPGCRSSRLPSMNCLPSAPGRHVCAMSKAFPTTKRARCSRSVWATNDFAAPRTSTPARDSRRQDGEELSCSRCDGETSCASRRSNS